MPNLFSKNTYAQNLSSSSSSSSLKKRGAFFQRFKACGFLTNNNWFHKPELPMRLSQRAEVKIVVGLISEPEQPPK